MKEIKLTKGQVALVDDEDFEYLNQFKWHASMASNGKNFYARRNSGYGVIVHMHRFIAKKYSIIIDKEVDHIDGNGLNNQKINLRQATRTENIRNRRGWGKSGTKGVFSVQNKNEVRWAVRIYINGSNKRLGTYKEKEEAISVYNNYCLTHHREFAKIN